MKVNVYDISGREQFVQAESFGDNDIQSFEPMALRNLLINPRNPGSNRMPYLQDPNSPCIDDFIIGDNRFDYSNSKFLSDMLVGNLANAKKDISNYFAFQKGLINAELPGDCNIILIPDHYNAEKQEQLLRYCGLPREKTFLLWRSVAICLGAEEELQSKNVKENSKVAIIDPQSNNNFNVTILTMKKDGNTLVPSRSSFQKKENYPVKDLKMLRDNNTFQLPNQFWQHTWNHEGFFYVPNENGTWSKQQFHKPKYYYFLDRIPPNIDFFIVCNPGNAELKSYIAKEKIILENNKNSFALIGGGRFAVRKENNLPTYFDECESLYFIVQDRNNEKIVARELIKGGEYCRGGQVINGNINTEFNLEKDQNALSLLLHLGIITPDTQLKELTCSFEEKTEVSQRLTLYPSMIPGQGIAKVQVEARPLIKNLIELDFLAMKDAFVHNTYIPLTINYLESVFPRSFPIDFPDVEASPTLFNEYTVKNYVYKNRSINNDAFAQSRYPNLKSSGIERFERINIFGTKKGHLLPTNDKKLIEDLFKKIAADYKNTQPPDDFIRLAAWTYRCGIKQFKELIADTMDKVEQKAAGRNVSIATQEFTVCANMLSETEQQHFILCFNQYTIPIIEDAIRNGNEIQRVDHWIRALMGILMYSNDCLKNLSSEDCEKCVTALLCIWYSYACQGKKIPFICKVICCILFILRRRKYDNKFLKDQKSTLFSHLKEQCLNKQINEKNNNKLDKKEYLSKLYENKIENNKNKTENNEVKKPFNDDQNGIMAFALLQYLESKGSLDSLAGFTSNDN